MNVPKSDVAIDGRRARCRAGLTERRTAMHMLLLPAEQMERLLPCLQELAVHHNAVSRRFRGAFPTLPLDQRLAGFAADIRAGHSRVCALMDGDTVAGFCKVNIAGEQGTLHYLVLREAYRGQGWGKKLMDWAMQAFADAQVTRIEVQVVDGNPAQRLYEAYGFAVKTLNMERLSS